MIKSTIGRLFAVGLAFLFTSTLMFAQEQGQNRRQRGPGGGFGGGFGRTTGVLSLLSNDAVRADLKIDDDTKAKIGKLMEELGTETRSEMEKAGLGRDSFAGLQNLSEDERRSKMDEYRKKSSDITSKVTAKYISLVKEAISKEQFRRAEQIALQNDPIQGLNSTELAKELDLSAEVKEKVAALGKELDEKRRGLMGFGRPGAGGPGAGGQPGGFEAVRAKLDELNKERDVKLAEILGAKADAFSKLKGEPFDLAKLRQFGGGRGGRPAGAGGNRPQTENN